MKRINGLYKGEIMEFNSLHEMFFDRVGKYSLEEAYRFKKDGAWRTVTWAEYGNQVRNIALSLMDLGISKGDKVAIIASTRPEWDIFDKGASMIGGICVGIYQTLPPNQIEYILAHSQAKVILVEDEKQLEKIEQIKDSCRDLKTIITMDPVDFEKYDIFQFSDIVAPSVDLEKFFGVSLDQISSSIGHHDQATNIYTSGTTGPPKGAILTHLNLLAEAMHMATLLDVNHDDVTLNWLPLSHVYQRAAGFAGIWAGARSAYAESVEKLIDNLAEIKPTIFYSVPRIFEKAYSKIMENAQSSGFPKTQLFNWSMNVGRQASKFKQENKEIPFGLKLKFKLSKKLVFEKIKNVFGGRIRFIGSGAAPISREILEFFHAADITALEAYGATETSCGVTFNTPTHYRFGTVGRTAPGTELKIAEDGEILVKGPLVFAGYFKDEKLTREVLSEDGWYSTGDVGEFDNDGYLKITDRKKDIIVTSAGKNVAPQNIENSLKESLFISQAMVHGDKRKYLTCIVTLDPLSVLPWAKKEGIPHENWAFLNENPKVIELVENEIAKTNKGRAGFERVKYFKIVADDFTVESGELTPTLKVKRKIVTKKYKSLLDSMYE